MLETKQIQDAWNKRVKAGIKKANPPDLSDEADRSHFWTLVIRQYKDNMPFPNYASDIAFMMADAGDFDELKAAISASDQIPNDSKKKILGALETMYWKSAGDWPKWKAAHGG